MAHGDMNLIELNASLAPPKQGLKCVSAIELLAMDLPPRENILVPWLPCQGLALLYAPRGVGKTLVSLKIAYAVASGGELFGWQAPKARGVLFIDGEMPASAMQERLNNIISSVVKGAQAPLNILTPDLQEFGMPDLASLEGQEEVNEHITDDIELVIVDNLSALIRSGEENSAEGWSPIQTWALALRSTGKSVLFVHHSGKGGQQRGTSRREDVLDSVIALRRPADYQPSEGARFEIHFEKCRSVFGDDVAPFEVALTTDQTGRQIWTTRTLGDSTRDQVITLHLDGMTQKEIAEKLKKHKSTVCRHINRYNQQE